MKMRGFMSIALVLLALIPIFYFTDSYSTVRNSTSSSKNAALLAEMDFYRRADIRNALISEMRHGAEMSAGSQEMTGKIVIGKLILATPKIADIYEEDGVEVEFWCGLASRWELEELPQRMMEEGKTVRCLSCWGFTDLVVGTCTRRAYPPTVRPDLVDPCEFLLSADTANHRLGMNRWDGTRTSDSGETCVYPAVTLPALNPLKHAVFGASIYDSRTNTSSVVLIPEGYVIDYG